MVSTNPPLSGAAADGAYPVYGTFGPAECAAGAAGCAGASAPRLPASEKNALAADALDAAAVGLISTAPGSPDMLIFKCDAGLAGSCIGSLTGAGETGDGTVVGTGAGAGTAPGDDTGAPQAVQKAFPSAIGDPQFVQNTQSLLSCRIQGPNVGF